MQNDGLTSDSPPVTTGELWSLVKRGAVALWLFLRPWAFRVTCLVIAAVFSIVCLVKFRAESNLMCVFLAYLPAWLVGLPFLGTLGLGVVFACWRSMALSVLMVPLFIVWLGTYRLPSTFDADLKGRSDCLTVVTYNRGQGSDTVLAKFAASRPPDIIGLQDAGRRAARLAAMPEFVGHSAHFANGEFVLLSRWPILQNEPLYIRMPGASKDRLVGVRSAVDWEGRHVIVYNLHLPTPRDLLTWYGRHGTFMYGIVGLIPKTKLHERHQEYLAPWAARADWITRLAARISLERDPVVLIGDVNLPPVGKGYQELTRVLQDSHTVAGSGFGCTFPGNSKGLSRRISPWLRIDQVMASWHWEILSSEVGATGESQHLPVASVMALKQEGK